MAVWYDQRICGLEVLVGELSDTSRVFKSCVVETTVQKQWKTIRVSKTYAKLHFRMNETKLLN
jgi:hypothetical protein